MVKNSILLFDKKRKKRIRLIIKKKRFVCKEIQKRLWFKAELSR